MSELNDGIKANETSLMHKIESLAKLQEQITSIEIKIAIAVADETDIVTNKVLFSNETKRKAEITKRLGNDEAFKKLKTEATMLSCEIKELEISIGFMKRDWVEQHGNS